MGQTSTGTVRMSAAVAILAVLGLLLSLFALAAPIAAVEGDKETICHATPSEANPYVAITISDEGGTENEKAGHFNEDGSAVTGHEQDFLLPGEATKEDCAEAAFAYDIIKVASVGSVNAGGSFSYTITVDHNGTKPATEVVVTDNLADSLTGVTASFSINGGTATNCTVGAGNTISCNVGTLPVNGVVVVTVNVTTTAASCPSVVNTSTVDSAERPPENSNQVTVAVNCPSLSISKTPDGGVVTAGSPISFTIGVTNSGLGAATNVDIDDLLPAGFEWVENPDKTECSITLDVATSRLKLHCDIASLAASGAGSSFSVTVSSPTTAADCSTTAYENRATADADNHAEIFNLGTVTVQCPVLEVTLGGNPTPTPTPTPVVRAGTLAASVPNTAMDGPMNQLPVVFLALLTLGSLGYLGRRNLIGIRNRR